jgi:hypothetical protein
MRSPTPPRPARSGRIDDGTVSWAGTARLLGHDCDYALAVVRITARRSKRSSRRFDSNRRDPPIRSAMRHWPLFVLCGRVGRFRNDGVLAARRLLLSLGEADAARSSYRPAAVVRPGAAGRLLCHGSDHLRALDHVAACGANRSPPPPSSQRRSIRIARAGSAEPRGGGWRCAFESPVTLSRKTSSRMIDRPSSYNPRPVLRGRRGLTACSLGAVLGAGQPTRGASPS